MKRLATAILAMLFAGCAASPAKPTSRAVMSPSSSVTPGDAPVAASDAVEPRDAVKATAKYFQIELYQIAVSQGTISGNAAFWKPFDETFLGIWQHDLLAKNGLRVGRAPLTEMKYLTDQLADAEQSKQSMIGMRAKDEEIGVRSNVEQQTLFYFDKDGESAGHDFEKCDDLFAISFRQTPREPDHVRLSIAPMIRAHKQLLEVTNPLTMAVRWFQPQTLYDLGITLDLGVDQCLVIAPDQNAISNQTLVGRQFMMEERPAERVEKVLVIIPRVTGTLTEQASN